jgi:excisionase family DNA binding protein
MDTAQDDPSQPDPLTVGDLITLEEAAEYAGLSKESIHSYVKKGRLKARKRGWMWFTTQAAVEEYLLSRNLQNIPKKYRRES